MRKLAFLGLSLALVMGIQPVRAADDEAPNCRVQGRYNAPLIVGWTAWREVDAETLEDCASAAEALLGGVVSVSFPAFGSGTTTAAAARIKRGKFRYRKGRRVTTGTVK